MQKITKVFLTIAGVIALLVAVVIGIIAYTVLPPRPEGPANDLGLTRSDMVIGGLPSMDLLRTRTKAVADTYLAARQAELTQILGQPYRLILDYTLQSKIRLLGYRSSFYYYCWDIYLPYSAETEAGKRCIVTVQLSDGLQGHKHDPEKFRVLRSMVVDDNGQTIKTME